MSVPPLPISPPPPAASPPSSGVRRHHTITASSRSARTASRATISEESQEQQSWNEDELADQEWGRTVGAVGEKGSLHRQSSLPTKYNRGLYRVSVHALLFRRFNLVVTPSFLIHS